MIAARSPEANHKLTDDSMEFDAEVERRGQLIMAQPLHEPETAVTIRTRNGKMSSTDGPFAETKEQLGGYYLVDCKDLDEAIEASARMPVGPHGTVEIRPVAVYDEEGRPSM